MILRLLRGRVNSFLRRPDAEFLRVLRLQKSRHSPQRRTVSADDVETDQLTPVILPFGVRRELAARYCDFAAPEPGRRITIIAPTSGPASKAWRGGNLSVTW